MNGYLWLKALHILSIISWMVGMLYMPRLFVYHVAAPRGSSEAQTFEVMERRLQKGIMLPAMIASWITGLWLAVWGGWFHFGWLHTKLLLVVLLSGVHGYLAAERKKIATGTSKRSSRDFRIINEIPTLIMIAIVILVVVKPF